MPGQRALKPPVLYFPRLGFLRFGGPVALVGQMERELVGEREWLAGRGRRDRIPAAAPDMGLGQVIKVSRRC